MSRSCCSRSCCAQALIALLLASGPAQAGIDGLDVSAFVRAEAVATNTINDPVLFHDIDAKSVDQSGTFTAAAGLPPNSIGGATAFSSISVNSSSSAQSAHVSFSWSGDGQVELDDPVPGAFKNIGSNSAGKVDVQFEVVETAAQYTISFSSGSFVTRIFLTGGGGLGGFVCANDLNDCPIPEDNLQRSGVLPPGFYTVSASVSESCGDCEDGGLVVNCHNNIPVSTDYNANFSLSLTLTSTPSFRWINSAGGDFSVAANWESGQVPGSGDNAIVNLGGAFPINFGGSSARQLLVKNTSVDLLGTLLQLTSTSTTEPSLTIGGTAKAALKSGAINCRQVVVGDTPGSGVATLELLGASAQTPKLAAAGNLLVGSQQPGRLLVTDGELQCNELQLIGAGAAAVADFENAKTRVDVNVLSAGVLGPATINLGFGASLNVAGNTTLGSGANGATTLDVAGFTLANGVAATSTFGGSGTLKIGDAARADVVVRSGAFVSYDTVQVQRGSVMVDGIVQGEQSQFAAGGMSIGGNAPGEVTVDNGALLTGQVGNDLFVAVGAGSALRVRGKGSLSNMDQPSALELMGLDAGVGGPSTIEFGPLGLIQVDEVKLGVSGGSAAVTVDAADLFVNVNMLITGSGSRLDLRNAATAHFAQTFNFRARQGDVDVAGPDTFATFSGSAVIAGPDASSNPTVTVHAGGVFSQASAASATLQIGDAAGPGRLVVNHPITGFQDPVPSQVNFTNVTIERGLARIEGAGRLGATQTLTVRDRLEVDSNLLTFANVVCDRLVIAANGVVRVCPNGMLQATTIVNDPGGRLEGQANVSGNVVTGGLISVGCSPGTLTIEGDFEQSETGFLEMQAAGVGPGQFDVLRVSGAAKLGGTLEVRFIDGYLPKQGDQFEFFDVVGGMTGEFFQVSFPDLAPGFDAELRADGGKLRLTAMTDGLAGAGVVIDAFADQAVPACGAGLCGSGAAPLLAIASLAVMRRRRGRGG